MSVSTLEINELFYSIQGEGRRAGEPSVFIRLKGCSAKYACAKSGVKCDTEFESGREMTLGVLLAEIRKLSENCRWLIFTGGEPADQLSPEVIQFFHYYDFKIAVETSGVKPLPDGIDWISLSPKVAEHVVRKNFPAGVTELRYIRHAGQEIPQPSVSAKYHFLSPHSDGQLLNAANVRHCIELCRKHPQWSLNLQLHKMWGVL